MAKKKPVKWFPYYHSHMHLDTLLWYMPSDVRVQFQNHVPGATTATRITIIDVATDNVVAAIDCNWDRRAGLHNLVSMLRVTRSPIPDPHSVTPT